MLVGSKPSCTSFSLISGIVATWRTTAPSRSPIAFGVFTGTKKPVHTVDDRLGKPASETVGTCGTAAERCGVVTASPLSLPDVTNATAGGSVTTDSSVWLDMVAVSACAAPGNGTCVILASGNVEMRWASRSCGTEPVPGEE